MARSETRTTNGIVTTKNAPDNNASEMSLALATAKLVRHEEGHIGLVLTLIPFMTCSKK